MTEESNKPIDAEPLPEQEEAVQDGVAEPEAGSVTGSSSDVVSARPESLLDDAADVPAEVPPEADSPNGQEVVDLPAETASGDGDESVPADATTILLHHGGGEWRATRIGVQRAGIEALGPRESLAHALAWSGRIREEALPLFPRVMCRLLAGDKDERFDAAMALERLDELGIDARVDYLPTGMHNWDNFSRFLAPMRDNLMPALR